MVKMNPLAHITWLGDGSCVCVFVEVHVCVETGFIYHVVQKALVTGNLDDHSGKLNLAILSLQLSLFHYTLTDTDTHMENCKRCQKILFAVCFDMVS